MLNNAAKIIQNVSLILLLLLPFYSEALFAYDLNQAIFIASLIFLSLINVKTKISRSKLFMTMFNCSIFLYILLRMSDSEFFLNYLYFIFISFLFLLAPKFNRKTMLLSLGFIIIFIISDVQSLINSYLNSSRGALNVGPISLSLIIVLFLSQIDVTKIKHFVFVFFSFFLLFLSQSKGPVLSYLLAKFKQAFNLKILFPSIIFLPILFLIFDFHEILRVDAISQRLEIISYSITNFSLYGWGANYTFFHLENYQHNIFFQLLFELGLIGLIIYFYIIFIIYKANIFVKIIFITAHFSFNALTMLPIILISSTWTNNAITLSSARKN